MKQLLKNFVAWLDKRFPDKIVITTELYGQLLKRIDALEKNHVDEFRVKQIESEIGKLNIHMGFGNPLADKMSARGVFQR